MMPKKAISYFLASTCIAIGVTTTFFYKQYQQKKVDPFKEQQIERIRQQISKQATTNNHLDNNLDSIVNAIYTKKIRNSKQYQIRKENSSTMLLLLSSMYVAGVGFFAYGATRKDNE